MARSNGWRWVGGAVLLIAGVASAQAEDVQSLRLTGLAATCANCHGTGGRAVDDAAVPGLAGMPASYTVDQLKAFKSGARPATVMHQITKGYSDAQIELIAAYFAAQKK